MHFTSLNVKDIRTMTGMPTTSAVMMAIIVMTMTTSTATGPIGRR